MKFGTGRSAVEVNIPTRAILFQAVREKFAKGDGFALATLNLDHLTKLPSEETFAEAYRAQDLVVADGRPVVWLSKLAQQPLELMPGSDLVIPLCELAAEMQMPVALMGSSDEALAGAKAALEQRVESLNICLTHAPAYGFDPSGPAAEEICTMLNDSGARLCFIALGAPKQELFAAFARSKCPAVGFASIGAGLDFLSGHQVRAPKFMRALALEWLWRALQSPKRMVPRYAKCFAILPRLTLDAWRQR
ncbi:WecB/TagA/CpsF family glycosyltransferase [Sulfitobacter donghicola]|uniref:Glycosyl transferase n=1 Tax=Sulfitobacter donghicola DSW-25 = KCTC 12864 = JCM 14565 TaxID=1300350 RepID=A0A073II60_9RHOB|nr:WecB/TagA/CpsF family glycosyltransferase [Sulfitobacter donghicola]KEJ89255.1 glycosyl transferase [Sulfitobacter donghicola DSW-25 = KCTC 12864 = JCM 14565]KIN69051.1 Glycosyl transferase, WecB/TagA/CpsF family protein [Sulfitobacter donghicola DSW-25 = KCTC 12864 = JCM 14565]